MRILAKDTGAALTGLASVGQVDLGGLHLSCPGGHSRHSPFLDPRGHGANSQCQLLAQLKGKHGFLNTQIFSFF